LARGLARKGLAEKKKILAKPFLAKHLAKSVFPQEQAFRLKYIFK
jgi:hypothetical protein